MVSCTGRGADGGHCCWIGGQVCEFLDTSGELPRCGLWDIQMKRSSRWRDAPVGQWFAETHPGFDCKDWPQNIPVEMAKADITGPYGLCCGGRGNA